MKTTSQMKKTVPILKMTGSLGKVYRYCRSGADPLLAVLAKKGVGGDPLNCSISIAAELAHWLAEQPYLLSKEQIHVVCPVLNGKGIDGYDQQDQAPTVAAAVAHLLGRDAQSIQIQLAQTLATEIAGVTQCKNGIWRNGAKPGEQMGDAIWLGNLEVENLLAYYCFSDDMAQAAYSRIPIGLSADGETELAKRLEVLKITGFFTNPLPIENQLSDSGAGWEAYRHSRECLFATTNSYILSISGQSDRESSSAGIRKKIDDCKRLLEFVAAGEAMGVEVTPDSEFTWCLATPGTLLKSRFDSNRGERYQMLDSSWMIRLSDGAILSIVGGQDFRGIETSTVSSQVLAGHPGVSASWLARSMWGELVFKHEKDKLAGNEPLIGRNAYHKAQKSMAKALAEMPKEEADGIRPIFASVLSTSPPVSDEALTFFHLMEDGRHDQALEYLKATPGLIDCTDSEGDTPLMKAVEARNIEMVKQIIKMKASINQPAGDGFCAIHIAARNGLTTICEKLIDAGADIDNATPHGWTPLMCAIESDFEGCAKLLVRRGAKTNRSGPRGTALAMAKSRGFKLL